MPSDSAPATKRRSAKAATKASPDDHRKRRRNRTTQSCLNCHATKRMCDRGRPCSRCTQLGLTGLCVYEVDDPANSNTQDERSRLQNRIAELEGVIRELKNKPHPRWADVRESSLLHSSPRSPASSLKAAYPDGALENPSSFGWSDLLNWESSGSSDSSYSRSPVSTPSPLLVSASRPSESLSGLPWNNNMPVPIKYETGCSCMSEPACYNATVELASELRRASAVLSRSLNHCFGSQCPLNTKIRELESLTVYVARFAPQFETMLISTLHRDALRGSFCSNPLQAAPMRVKVRSPDPRQQFKIARDPFWDENGLPALDDSFMAWIPPAGRL
ncbi:hypothetical protein B0H19DRAFT_43146 [Mycena capillaripes]|nr:hypothetical protein B0H19DRAFT_43146 [Mycena capillaripes]